MSECITPIDTRRIIGHYANGAVQVEHGFIAYDDCEACMGLGSTPQGGLIWGRTVQCHECSKRFMTKDYIRARVKAIISMTETIIREQRKRHGWSFAKTKRLPEDARKWVEDFTVNHPLAQEYRRLLVAYWEYHEPEFIPVESAEGQIESVKDKFIALMRKIDSLPRDIYLDHGEIVDFREGFPMYLHKVIEGRGSIDFILKNTVDDAEEHIDAMGEKVSKLLEAV